MTGREASARMVGRDQRGGGVSYSLTTVLRPLLQCRLFSNSNCSRVRQLTHLNRAIIVWSTFVQTLCLQIPRLIFYRRESLARRAKNLGQSQLVLAANVPSPQIQNLSQRSHIPSCWIASRRTSSSIKDVFVIRDSVDGVDA